MNHNRTFSDKKLILWLSFTEQLELQILSLDPFIELKALTPYSNISIYVMAYNSKQGSGPSDKIYVIMGEDSK